MKPLSEAPLKAKLEKVGLAVGSDGTLDLTRSISSPLKHESNTRLPLYDWRIHKAGDKVRMPSGEIVIVPDLDADGSTVEAGSTGRLVSDNLFELSFNPDPKPEKKKRRG